MPEQGEGHIPEEIEKVEVLLLSLIEVMNSYLSESTSVPIDPEDELTRYKRKATYRNGDVEIHIERIEKYIDGELSLADSGLFIESIGLESRKDSRPSLQIIADPEQAFVYAKSMYKPGIIEDLKDRYNELVHATLVSRN